MHIIFPTTCYNLKYVWYEIELPLHAHIYYYSNTALLTLQMRK